ncbi:hypothetical protein ZIOFF_073724 [Zingiber officinale]|uniref:Uncharacterized protein n=1 Tax=Zingiber officinale TaxID=94328 RepID=A0A8J5C6C6_ZINOF|nr:hypothetical protein ZIOFF_073724 [Zingiber officinale]
MGDSGDHGRRNSPVDVAQLNAASYLDPHYWDERFAPPRSTMNGSKTTPTSDTSSAPSSIHPTRCGNSLLCEELHKDDIADMTCVDISPVAVERMRSRFRDKGHEGFFLFSLHRQASRWFRPTCKTYPSAVSPVLQYCDRERLKCSFHV